MSKGEVTVKSKVLQTHIMNQLSLLRLGDQFQGKTMPFGDLTTGELMVLSYALSYKGKGGPTLTPYSDCRLYITKETGHHTSYISTMTQKLKEREMPLVDANGAIHASLLALSDGVPTSVTINLSLD